MHDDFKMRVISQNDDYKCQFGELFPGDCFYKGECVYMKASYSKMTEDCIPFVAINLETGYMIQIPLTERVLPIKSELRVFTK